MSISRLVVLDAATLTGTAIVQGLFERGYPLDGVVMLSSGEGADGLISVGDEEWPLLAVEDFDFRDSDLCLVSGDSRLAELWVPRMRDAGCRVIDDTAYSRTLDVPLLLPESAQAAVTHAHIAVPCAISVALALILDPLVKGFGVESVQVTSWQAVSGVGQSGIDALVSEVRAMFNQFEQPEGVFGERIAFNLIPQIGPVNDEGWSEEELKIMREVPLLLDTPDLVLSASCVRAPVFFGHGGSLAIRLRDGADLAQVRDLLGHSPALSLMEAKLPTPQAGIGADAVIVGRLRFSAADNCLHACFSIDNIRRGAAFNTVELALLALGR